jgi:hypothetical protein
MTNNIEITNSNDKNTGLLGFEFGIMFIVIYLLFGICLLEFYKYKRLRALHIEQHI